VGIFGSERGGVAGQTSRLRVDSFFPGSVFEVDVVKIQVEDKVVLGTSIVINVVDLRGSIFGDE